MKSYSPIAKALTRHQLAESRMDPLALGLTMLLGGAYARFALKIRGMEIRHLERLVKAWLDHMEGRGRLLLAFRHPYGEEPQILSYAVSKLLPRLARDSGFPLPGPARTRFVHGYEVPLWSGAFIRWLLPRIGAVPVYHVKFDKPSLDRIRGILRDGPYPLALAPEGQISYRAETLPRLEGGAIRLGFWCVEELRAAGRNEHVIILPVSIHYRFDERGMRALDALLARLEVDIGLPRAPSIRNLDRRDRRVALLARLDTIDSALIRLAEAFYGIGQRREETPKPRDERMDSLLETALRRAEAAFGIKAEGDRIARVYRIRQEGWDRIYPESGLAKPGSLPRLLEDRKAGEAWYVMRHMEFVDLCHYLDSGYPRVGMDQDGSGEPAFDRLVETAYSLCDAASRLVGGDISHRPSVIARRVSLSIAPPLDLTERFEEYRGDRKAATDRALADLGKRYTDCIKERIDERRDWNEADGPR